MKENVGLTSWATLVALMVVWGSSFILIKRGLDYFTALEIGALRIIFAWLFLLPWALRRMRGISKRQWLVLLVVGVVGSSIPAYLFPKAQTGIDSSLAGILNSLTPLFTLMIGMLFFQARPRWFNIAGVMIGLAGAIGLLSVSGGKGLEFNIGYAVYILLATLCYAVNANIIKYALPGISPITITSLAFFLVGPPIFLGLLAGTDLAGRFSADSGMLRGLAYVAILGVVGTGLALMFFNRLIQRTSPVFASSVTYLIPIVALFWGILDGEHFHPQYLLWIALILGGVALVNRRKLWSGR